LAAAVAPGRRGAELNGIDDLPIRIDRLEGEARARSDRLLEATSIDSRTDPPPSMAAWLTRTFGSVDAVRSQRLVRVTNLATLDSAMFAALRTRRPIESNGGGPPTALADEIAETIGDPFCDPLDETPADTFGRVRGRRMVTGANAAQADAHHAVLVFDDHDPLAFDVDLVADLLATAREWAERARGDDPAAVHYLLAWNCLWRAGGSIVHGHAQAILGRGRPHARLGRFRRDASRYATATGPDLVADLVEVHRDLGLSLDTDGGVAILAHLVPIKEHEIVVIGQPNMDERDPAFASAVGRAMVALRDHAGVRSFNLGLWRPALDAADDPMPPIARIVDRGDPAVRPSDIGAMELYGTPIVSTDPYRLIEDLRQAD
jgi:hypothetical protein